MKKVFKNLLIGAGIAAAGWAVYSVLKKPEETPEEQNVAEAEGSTASTGFTKEYIEHRKQKIREATAAKKAAQENLAPLATAESAEVTPEMTNSPGEDGITPSDDMVEETEGMTEIVQEHDEEKTY